MIATDEVMEPFLDGASMYSHGITFGGHPVMSAIALKNIEIMKREKFVERVLENEGAFRATLAQLLDLPIVGDVRGTGYFYAIELVKNTETRETFSAEECETLLRGFLSPAPVRARPDLPRRRPRRPGDPDLPAARRRQEEFDEIVGILGDVLEEAGSRLVEGASDCIRVWLTPLQGLDSGKVGNCPGRSDQNGNSGASSSPMLTRRYGKGDTAVDALRGITLDVEKGHLTAVMGPSGSGKSTLMHILAGLDKPTSGAVAVSGTEITTLKDSDLTSCAAAHRIRLPVLQPAADADAEENITLPLSIAGEKADPEFFRDLIEKVGLADRLHHRPSELSGGQQQRVAIARALVRPTVLFADEPTGNLDSATGTEILALMRDSVDSYGQTTVMVTHEPRAAAIADRILFLADGVIVRDLPGASQAEVLATLTEIAAA